LAEEYEVLQQIFQGTMYTPEREYVLGRLKIENNRIVYLDASAIGIKKLPDSIGQLTQLRTLSISRNELRKLPETIRQLDNLQKINVIYNPLNKKSKQLLEELKTKGVKTHYD